MMDFSKVSIAMATKNEEKAVGRVINEIKKVTETKAEIVIVDGSSDNTPEIARKLGAKVIRQKPQGYGIALKKALLSTTGEFIVTLDCDCTYPTEVIPELIKLLEEGYDVVSGSRLMKRPKNMTLLNYIGNKFFAVLASVLFNFRITDLTTGMRAYKRDVITSIEWTENIGLSAELLLRPISRGYKIIEIPIEYKPRVGKTKLNPFKGGLSFIKSILKIRVEEWMRKLKQQS